jgi:hypothetical protein
MSLELFMSCYLCILGAYLSLCFIILFAKLVPYFIKVGFLRKNICMDQNGNNVWIEVRNAIGFPIEYCSCTLSTSSQEEPYKNCSQEIIIPSKSKKNIAIMHMDADDNFVKSFNKGGVVFLKFKISSIIGLVVTKKISKVKLIKRYSIISKKDPIKITDKRLEKQNAIDELLNTPEYEVSRFVGYCFEKEKNCHE